MTIHRLIGACAAFRQLYRELQTYTDTELAELGLRRGDTVRIAFATAFRTPRRIATPQARAFGLGQLRRA